MGYGGLQPFPRRFGRTAGQSVEVVTNSILSQLGTAYDSSTTSKVWVKATATARALCDVAETSQRLRNQFDPNRLTVFLPRWEAIFGITPPPGSTHGSRRLAVAARWTVLGQVANGGGLVAVLQRLLRNTFVAVVHTAASAATSIVPASVVAGAGGAPAGTVTVSGKSPGGAITTGYWSSTTHHLAFQVTQPAWMLDADYYREVGQTSNGLLRGFLPAWVTFSSFRDGPFGPGFYLDDPHNLDNERLLDVVWNAATVGGAAVTSRLLPVYFSRSATAPTYCIYHGFNNAIGPRSITITLAKGTAAGVAGVLRSGQDSTGPLVANLVSGANTFPALAAGNYTIEVSGGAVSTLGTEPGTVTLTVATP